ncbi:hypothetical protein AAE478_003269 [Parahypoxylon ruwenzoriense]
MAVCICDEARPACSNCVRFATPCEYTGDRRSDDIIKEFNSNITLIADKLASAPAARRGKGRPRRDWTLTPISTVGNTTSPSSITSAPSPETCFSEGFPSLNIADTELLLQFISSTSHSLIKSNGCDCPMWKFWAYEVPRMGLSNHFVLHLILAVAGHHLARLNAEAEEPDRRNHYLALAQNHFHAGLAEFRETLPSLNKTNSRPLYVSALLVCWCSFAAGPSGPSDLLVCEVGNNNVLFWIPLVHGVRIIKETIESCDFFANLTDSCGTTDEKASTYSDLSLTIEWEEPLRNLQDRIVSSGSPFIEAYNYALSDMRAIFEEACGKSDGSRSGHPSNRFVLGWLYRMQDSFVSCVHAAEPLALLLLAYYTVLLGTMNQCWFIEDWPHHLISRVDELLDPEDRSWLQWPREQVQLLASDHKIYT